MVYMDPTVTDVACAGLNGMRMGERTLTVRRATEVRICKTVLPLHCSDVRLCQSWRPPSAAPNCLCPC